MCKESAHLKKCLSSGQFHISPSLVLLQKPRKSSRLGMKRGRRAGGRDNIWQWMSFLMSREDLHRGSGDCRGALCSGSERRRWRDRKCTWAEDECQSGSEDTERERAVVSDMSEVGVWVNPAFELYWM